MKHTEKIVVEYNPTDGNFHIQPLSKTIKGNVCCALEGWAHSYLLLGVFDDYDSASRFCEEMREELKMRAAT